MPTVPAAIITAPVISTSRPKRCASGIANGAADECADAERDHRHPGPKRRVVLPSLHPQREHQGEPLHADREGELHDQPGGERRPAQEPRPDQRRDPGPRPALLGDRQGHEGRDTRRQHPPPPRRPAQPAAFEHRVDDGDEGDGEHRGAHQIRPPRRPRPRLGHDRDRGDQRSDRDRDVDEEHGPPAPAEQVRLGEDAAEHEPDRRCEPEDRAVEAEGGRPLLAGEHRPEGGEHLG